MQIAVGSERVKELKEWFADYVHTFQHSEPEKQQNIDMKRWHTLRVCTEISSLGTQLGLNDSELRLAEIIAMLHDIGRFEQYTRYHTFLDRKSENHAELGVAIIMRSGILDRCEDTIRDLIVRSVRYHNRASLPTDESETCLFFSRLLRDADKLDIWKVVTDYYSRKEAQRNGAIELDLPDTPGFSDEVYDDLINKRIVNIEHIRNLNDFKLLQIGWVFDINFQPTLDRVRERRYLKMIGEALPPSERVHNIFSVINESCFR
jgi:putative nucleotidyltransferase with HDIG domain